MKEAYYFRHDCNARQDEKILALRMKHKWIGYGLYWAIIEKLRESKNYECVKDYNVIAFDLQVDAGLIKSIINDFGLFTVTEDGKGFYSERLKKDMMVKDEISQKRSQAGKRGLQNRWEDKKNNSVDYQQNKEMKGDEVVGEDSKCIANAKQMHSKPIAIKENKIKEYIEEKDIPNGISKKKDENAQRFVPPTIEEVKSYVEEKGYLSVDAERFVNFYESKGWYVGKNKMKNWKSAVANWQKTEQNQKTNGNANNNPYEANREQADKHKLSLAERIQELDARERQRGVVIGGSKEG